MACLQGGIVRVLDGEFELLILSLFQNVQEVLGEPPSFSRMKGRKVVSAFRFLLNSMHRRCSFFLMSLILP